MSNSIKRQFHFFELVAEDEQARGRVWQIGENRWRAEIDGGWWVGFGDTEQAAIEAVRRRFNDEVNHGAAS